jgi:hypothetical protein
VAVDEHPTSTVDELHGRRAAATGGVPVVVAALRGGQRMQVFVIPRTDCGLTDRASQASADRVEASLGWRVRRRRV